MVSQSVAPFMSPINLDDKFDNITNATFDEAWTAAHEYRRIQIVSTLTFMVGVLQILIGVFRLGFVAAYLSDQLIAGFTTGAAVHVFTSQINSVLNVKLPRYGGVGALYYIYRDLITAVAKGEVCTRVRAHTSTVPHSQAI
jgi:MFS superfamily sulfate permease-like transporter